MTRLYIDKQEVASSLPSDLKSWGDVLSVVEKNHLSSDHVIRHVQIDGQPLVQSDRTICPDRIGLFGKIEIFTSSLREAALDSIREANIFLERVAAAIPCVSSSFRSRADLDDYENMKQFYEGFYWVNLLLDRLEHSFRIPFDSLRVDGVTAREHHLKLAGILKKVIEAHEKQDFGLVADLLECEIAPLIPISGNVLEAIREHIGSQS